MMLPDVKMRINGYRIGKYFWLYEFQCPCCHYVKVSPKLVFALDAIRERKGIIVLAPDKATRCRRRQQQIYIDKNKKRVLQGKEPLAMPLKSYHLTGEAGDVVYTFEPDDYPWLISLGITGIGHGHGWTHLDVGHKEFVTWKYDY